MADYIDEIQKAYPLDGVGTRFQHYNELKELFMDGIEIVKNMQNHLVSDSDRERLKQMEAAVFLIEKRLELLAGYDRKIVYSGTLPTTLREIETNRLSKKLLLKGKSDDEPEGTAKDSATSSDIT
jgi:hypothetical protein